ncbi:MAG: sugar transferase [Elusimicrobiota bacterium]|jgi:exopolysaccharide biosynthesis polyprenyl glycosylphosphotransferase
MPRFFADIRFRRFFYRTALLLGDALCVYLSLRAAYWMRFHWPLLLDAFPAAKGVPSPELYVPLRSMALAVWMFSFVLSGFYRRLNMDAMDEIVRIAKGVAMGWLVVMAGTFLYRREEYSRLVLVLSGLNVVAGVFVFRELMKWLYGHVAFRWWEPHTVLVLGSGRMSKAIQRILGRHKEINLVHKTTRDPREIAGFLRDHPIREVFAAEPDLDHAALIAMSDACEEQNVPFRIVPDVLELRMGEVIFDDSLGLPTYRVKPISLHGWTYFYKRLFDVVFSTFIISAAVLPLLLIALLIRLDSRGPVLYRQPRSGYKGRAFNFIKFRTMITNADDYLEELKKKSDRLGPVFKMKDDPRVTRVGKWLRRYSLDELPQIINVLRGEMSLVGPRPQVLWEASAYDEWAKKRLNVLPGITGLWQVSGRAQLSYEQMIELDVYYIEHWSPGLDLKILMKTLPTILLGDGAY